MTRPVCWKKSIILSLLLLLGSNMLFAGNHYDYLLGKSFTERWMRLHYRMDSLEKQGLPATLLELKDAESWANNKDKELGYAFKLMRLQMMAYYQPSISTEKELQAFADKTNVAHIFKVQALHTLAEYYWRKKDYRNGFEKELRAYELYRNIDIGLHPIIADYTLQFAARYYGFRDYENAKRILLTVPEKYRNLDPPGGHLYYNLLGLSYRNLGLYDSAVHYFKMGYDITVDTKSYIYQAIFSGNIGIAYYYQKRFDEAIPLLERDINYCLENNRASDNAIKSMSILGDIYLQQGNAAKASTLLTTAYNIVKRDGYWERYDLLEFVYPITAKIYAKQGNTALAYAFLDSTIKVRDSINRQKSALILAGAQNHVAAQLHLAEVEKLVQQKKMQVIVRNSLIAGVLLIGVLALLIINLQKIAGKRKEEKLQSEKQLVATELTSASAQLQLFTKSIHEKNELIENFSRQLEILHLQGSNAQQYDAETMIKLRETTILTDEEWENFRRLFEKVHGNYLERLKIKIPGLSPAETRFVALTKLQLSNKEMAGMLGISTDAVRMNKHRLRKKLNLPEETSIDELIGSL